MNFLLHARCLICLCFVSFSSFFSSPNLCRPLTCFCWYSRGELWAILGSTRQISSAVFTYNQPMLLVSDRFLFDFFFQSGAPKLLPTLDSLSHSCSRTKSVVCAQHRSFRFVSFLFLFSLPSTRCCLLFPLRTLTNTFSFSLKTNS